MEYMNRGDLRHVLAHTTSPANWPWSAKLDVAHSVAQALFYLHSQQMIHRDLKSRNVLLDSKKGTKLADFGTSKQHVYEGDSMTAGVGTFRWMAPEMLLFQPYSNAVDVYSFGVLLSELATHTLPYAGLASGSDEASIARSVIYEHLRPSFGFTCPLWVQELGLRCMVQEPQARPNVTEIIYALEIQRRAGCPLGN
ncbi:Aste57867_6206 [Aphanomyces stellatus]|uniref:Aste57867_6206 protein n=1 Tax=Aphanomyces stellatus TaxID=120398 RepID=A0A485KFJ9_9STRA|nr:hypothetical protein As57867_006192 [Aphanomyces stellatus]VFT83209.1 Aste57867_6206 [Aphanomyces stellatus]